MKISTLVTFKERGLTKTHKQQQLIQDVAIYRTDVYAIPETKV